MTEKDYNDSVDTWSDSTYRFAVHYCGNATVAQDLVQEAFTALWEQRSKVQTHQCKAFLLRVIYNKAMSHLRHSYVQHRAHEEMALTDPSTTDTNTDFDLQEVLQRALQTLPELQRALVVMKDLNECSYKEIAQTLQLSENQVQVYLFRARVSLKKLLTAQGYGI